MPETLSRVSPRSSTEFMAHYAREDEPNAIQAFLPENRRSLWPIPRLYEASRYILREMWALGMRGMPEKPLA